LAKTDPVQIPVKQMFIYVFEPTFDFL